MEDWAAIKLVTELLPEFPGRWAPFRGIRDRSKPRHDEMALGLKIVREGLVALGPVLPDEPTDGRFEALVDLRVALIDVVPDLREVTAERIRDFCEARTSELRGAFLSQGVSLTGLARACLRARFGVVAGNLVEDVPFYENPDPSDLRGLALAWLEENALLLREGDQARCLGLMVSRVGGEPLLPLAKRLYHHPNAGPEVKEFMSEIFVPQLVQQIQSGS